MVIDLDEKLYLVLKDNETLKTILFELGFKEIVKPQMIQTMGRFMSIRQGAKLRHVDLDLIIKRLIKEGYTIKGDNNE